MHDDMFKYQQELDALTNLNTGTLRKITEILSDFEQTYKFLDVKRKTFIAVLVDNILLSAPKQSTTRAEIQALASKEYKEFLEAFKESLKNYTDYKYKYETLINRIEILRSFLSLEKEKMHIR